MLELQTIWTGRLFSAVHFLLAVVRRFFRPFALRLNLENPAFFWPVWTSCPNLGRFIAQRGIESAWSLNKPNGYTLCFHTKTLDVIQSFFWEQNWKLILSTWTLWETCIVTRGWNCPQFQINYQRSLSFIRKWNLFPVWQFFDLFFYCAQKFENIASFHYIDEICLHRFFQDVWLHIASLQVNL